MTRTLQLAIEKAAELPEAAQEAIGREMLEQIESLKALRAEIQIGIDELDAGLGEELVIESMIRRLNAEHSSR
jgi:hypothetical protein